jgi:hypothetical protein
MIRKFVLTLVFLLMLSGFAGAAETTFAITFTEQAQGVATMQFDFVFPSPVSAMNTINVTQGPAAVVADKSISFNSLDTSRVRVVLFGMNQNIFSTGVVANITGDVTGITDPIPPIENVVLSDIAGITVAPGPDVLLAIVSTSFEPRTLYLSWTDSVSSDVVSYEIYRDTVPITSNTPVIATITGRGNRSYTMTDLPNGTYYFMVAYIDSSGLKGWSNAASWTISIGPIGGTLTVSDTPSPE